MGCGRIPQYQRPDRVDSLHRVEEGGKAAEEETIHHRRKSKRADLGGAAYILQYNDYGVSIGTLFLFPFG